MICNNILQIKNYFNVKRLTSQQKNSQITSHKVIYKELLMPNKYMKHAATGISAN